MGGGGSRRRTAGGRGQATIEFAFVAPLFFLCFFAAIDAGLWAIQTSASVSAAEQALRLAAAAANSPQSEDTPSPQVLFGAIRTQLQQAMFGTTAIASCPAADSPACDPIDDVRTQTVKLSGGPVADIFTPLRAGTARAEITRQRAAIRERLQSAATSAADPSSAKAQQACRLARGRCRFR